jgi:bilin biosynthesis protein
MADKRFFNLFNLTEDEAIALLDTLPEQLGEDDSRYIAASHLVNFPTERSIHALMRAVEQMDPSLDNRIVRRKSIETLGRLEAVQALPVIRRCLQDDDCYTVENAVWAIGEIGTQDAALLEEMAQLLERPGQSYRTIIHALAKLGYEPALDRIRSFVNSTEPPIASAAIAAVCRFTGDTAQMQQVVDLLQHPNVMARRLSIQDLIDAQYYGAIPAIARCPVSLVFRLRGIRLLGEAGMGAGVLSFIAIQPYLEQVLRDHPNDLELVHTYDQPPSLLFLIRELYDTDFGRCYLATKTLIEHHAEEAPTALFATYAEEATADYGAHFHVVKLFGWLKHAPAYELLVEALHNTQPQFQKSRAAAAIALGELGHSQAIPELHCCLESKIWDLKYASLMALEALGDTSCHEQATHDSDWLVAAKATATLTTAVS